MTHQIPQAPKASAHARPARAAGDSEHGSALVMVLMFSLVVTAVGSTMILSANTDHAISANERNATRALFAADAGLAFGYNLYRQNLIRPTIEGTAFSSTVGDPSRTNDGQIASGLEGGSFAGLLYDLGAETGRGAYYRIEATGTYQMANRSIEMTFMVLQDAFRFGYLAFNEATLHNHSGLAGPSFRIESTMFSNDLLTLPTGITVDGTIVAGDTAGVVDGSTVNGDVFANCVSNKGTINGDARRVAVVKDAAIPASPTLVDNRGNPYDWYSGRDTPGSFTNTGTITGTIDSVQIATGDEFRYNIFTNSGELKGDPDVNVIKYIAPPLIDFAAMKREALLNDNTFFTSMTLAMTYIMTKAADEVIAGKTVRIARVGTTDEPEWLYIQGACTITLKGRTGTTKLANGELALDALWLEGGIYTTGDWEFNGPTYNPAIHPFEFKQLSINALPYCYPAVLAYNHPAINQAITPIEQWSPTVTPAMTGGGSKLKMSSSVNPNEGFTYLNGLTLSQNESHFHHTKSAQELIRFNGAQLGYKLHNCDYFDFTYDPKVTCTRFLVGGVGVPQVISYRENR